MATLTSISPIYNPLNNGWIYFGGADDGTFWVRSTAGSWALVPPPAASDEVFADFQTFVGGSPPASLDDVLNDNSTEVIVVPPPIEHDPPDTPNYV